eukprot:s744_g14.t1
MSCDFDTDCPDGSIGCILSYNGCEKDVVINYALILAQAPAFYKCAGVYSLVIFVFYSAFQVLLCVLVHCSGVSVVWCAMLGYCLAVVVRKAG